MSKSIDAIRPLLLRRLVELDDEAATLRGLLNTPGSKRRSRPTGRTMSAAQKKAISVRMKKVWAEKRKKG